MFRSTLCLSICLCATMSRASAQDTFSGTYVLKGSTDRVVLQDARNGTVSGTMFTKTKVGNQDIRIRVRGVYMMTRARGQNDWLLTICGKGGSQAADMVICMAAYSDGPQKKTLHSAVARAQTTDQNGTQGSKEESAKEHQVWVRQ